MAPGPEKDAKLIITGHEFHSEEAYRHLLRIHHVLGSATLIATEENETTIFSSTGQPRHEARPDTLFRVASITKTATALCAFIFCDRGLLDLDRPFASWFQPDQLQPEDVPEGMTLRHLLSHTSGLSDPADLEERLLRGDPFPVFLKQCIQSSPGERFHYSNLGFGLIGCLLEQVAQQPVSTILSENVFQPLEMRATLDASSLNREDIMPISRVLPYHAGQDVTVTPLGQRALTEPDPLRHYGYTAGSMYADIFALRNMMRCLREGGRPLVSSPIWQEMRRAHTSYGKLSPTLSYGLGLLIIEDPGLSAGRILGHQGFAYGCVDGAFIEENTGHMVIMVNGGASEARKGRLGLLNHDLLKLTLRKELPQWQ